LRLCRNANKSRGCHAERKAKHLLFPQLTESRFFADGSE
jgi:hypothetical protein